MSCLTQHQSVKGLMGKIFTVSNCCLTFFIMKNFFTHKLMVMCVYVQILLAFPLSTHHCEKYANFPPVSDCIGVNDVRSGLKGSFFHVYEPRYLCQYMTKLQVGHQGVRAQLPTGAEIFVFFTVS
jgi:hypothetical protein